MSKDEKSVLSLGDRIQMSNVLPDKDSFERLMIRKGILATTEIKPEDAKKHELRTENGQIKWTNAELKYSYEFSQTEKDYIRDCLKDLSSKNVLGAEATDLYEQFV